MFGKKPKIRLLLSIGAFFAAIECFDSKFGIILEGDIWGRVVVSLMPIFLGYILLVKSGAIRQSERIVVLNDFHADFLGIVFTIIAIKGIIKFF